MNTLVTLSAISLMLSMLFLFRSLIERSRWKLKMSCGLFTVMLLCAAGSAGWIKPEPKHPIPLQVGNCVYTPDHPMVCN